MEYQYYNQFNFSKQLSQAISTIISKNANEDYVCKVLTITIRGDNESKRYEKSIQGINHSFLVVMNDESYKSLSKLSFKNKDEINMALQILSVFSQEYNGIFDSTTLTESFPYLHDFFTSLDNWRAQTGRVTIDDDVLCESIKRVLCKKRSIITDIKN